MSSKEEIREGVSLIIMESWGKSEKSTDTAYDILNYLHSQSCVLKVEGELPEMHEVYNTSPIHKPIYGTAIDDMLKAGYCKTEPLVEVNDVKGT